MIRLQNTENFIGITVFGDWDDLNGLYDAVAHIKDLYVEKWYDLLDAMKNDKKIPINNTGNSRQNIKDADNNILGFLYDIRHAYQGDRDFEYRRNNAENIAMLASNIYQLDEQWLARERGRGENGNLYFKVDFLYPWMLYYAITLSTMVEESYSSKDFERMYFEYNEIVFRQDKAIVQQFVSGIMQCLVNFIGKDKTHHILYYMDYFRILPNMTDLYGMCLCNYYCDRNKKGKTIKKNIMIAMAYTMIGDYALYDNKIIKFSDQKKCRADLEKALDAIVKYTGKHFIQENDVFEELSKIIKAKDSYTEMEAEQVSDLYGEVDWDTLKW